MPYNVSRRLVLKTGAAAALLASTILSGPASAAPVTIRVALKDFLSTDPTAVAYVAQVEKAMAKRGHDIHIELVDLPSSGYADALGIMLLSRDIPDLIYFQGGDEKFASQGVLEDWRPYIEKTKYLKNALYPHNKARLDNYPYLLYVHPLRAWQPVVREDWLKKAGAKPPETTKAFAALLRTLHEHDFDNDGTKNTWGITAAGSLEELDGFLNPAFGIDATWLKDEEGAWVNSQISDEERDKLKYYHQLFKDGLLDPEYITLNWQTKEDKFYTGRAGVVSASNAENVVTYETKMRALHPDVSLTVLDPPLGPKGQGLAAVDVSKESRGWALSALSEHKQEVVALLDFMASPEGQFMERLGVPGIHYKKEGDQIKPLAALGSWESPFLVASNYDPPIELLPASAEKYIDNTQRYFLADNKFSYPPEYAAALDAATNVYNAFAYELVSGKANFDQWDDYVAQWKSSGGSQLTEYAKQVLK
ncbi:extracellular solute-binding protein [Pararhizobium mangrovi]|uniref:Extracellular solute-binding protein n=1 Tax=Pararhizobium mangrovi TaxID=2590452 RepID=A0A506UI01_9HYPH|nr:extracellular solute-binding protein [Pararhizobium mangrovi]TPW32951.1 extracellular solute-binding protein [Pararhizobium mangrovi]